ncbi:PSD1 and planctomycete cytochrome C domain-containing protein [Humisphaera borealis]|uniref:PSD1 domain-containing protein n=1 Tax=Humisphaera borealis TaxID=2807512 RepID=A0A7M2WTE7_9BACT|nr:PSD1 and planctomycete cytochrome C domain-containing protein [Humisphaera borealis]QOV88788.1 PSD1 domain-containing protein [Humisphaera borealis]
MNIRKLLAAILLSGTAGAFAADAPVAAPALTAEQTQFFEAKIRPLLTAKCYDCHSAAQGKSRGSLVLDSRDGWKTGGDTGPALVPGDAENSLLIKAVSYTDANVQMPPKGQKLSDQEIADLTAWVKMGAPDPRVAGAGKMTGLTAKARSHWAYQPVKEPPVPQPKTATQGWIKNPVDAFILAKLEQNGMKPSLPAAREVLIRRVSYDLIGLPPTPEEVKAFVMDRRPDAYERLVDRLLASPHYGERWGRFWLDSARYSDTTGFTENNRKEDYRFAYAWTYRDWVIKAINEDKPYDQFLTEQIAADLLPDAAKKPDSLAALGFLTVGKRFANKQDTIDERIDAVTKSTMAITVSCARCHDHKFDPIPTADYYSLHGVFNSIEEPDEKPLVGAAPTSAAKKDFDAKMAELAKKNRDIYYDVLEETSAEVLPKAAGYILTSLYSRGQFRDPAAKQKTVKEFTLSSRGNGQLLNAIPADKRDDPVFAPFRWFAELGQERYAEAVKDVLDRIAEGGGTKVTLNRRVVAAFKGVSPSSLKSIDDVANVYGKLLASIRPQAKAYIEANRKATSGPVTGYDADLIQLIEVPLKIEPASVMTDAHLREIFGTLKLGETAYGRFIFNEINTLELTHAGGPGRAMVVADLATPQDSPILIRGEANNKGKVVPRQFLQMLTTGERQPFKQGSGRLELAKAIASKDNPLTARVLVNRVWLRHFGEGFVRTPDDLGVQSELPSHPELLDYLASRFVADGWSLKKLHKTILMSSTWQQASDNNPTYTQKDPDNRLLWRANLRRLDFEAIRDTMLQFSGKLDRTIGGKPVNLTDEPYSNRRSVYGYVDRGNLPELLSEFDYADPNRPNSKRATTIVPQQALFFMNSPMSADVARKVCSRPEFLKAGDDYARVRAMYEVIYQRNARPVEVSLAAEFYNTHILAQRAAGNKGKPPAEKTKSQAKADERAKADAAKPIGAKGAIQNTGETVERKPLTIWEQYAQALLFANEIAYVN